MTTILDLINNADVCATPLLIVILLAVGSKMVGSRPDLYQWGLRVAAGAFVAYGIYGGVAFQPSTTDDWVRVAVRGLVAAGLALGLSWIFLPAASFVYRHAIGSPLTKVRDFAKTADKSRTNSGRYDEEQRRRALEDTDRQAREANQARSKADAQRRRTDARASALLSYTIYAPKLGNRLTREMFDKYVADFMGDQHAPEDVERRGQELISIFEKHVQETQPQKETRTVEDLARWFQEQKQRIESLPVDERTKKTHMVNLNERYAELTAKLLESMGP